MSKSDFQVFQIMSDRNLDIAFCPDVIGAKTAKGGGIIEVGVPAEAIRKVLNGALGSPTHYVAVYIVNKDQFTAIKDE